MNNKILGPVIASLIGLIPNCASSVIISQLYVENVISAAIMISGLLVNAGVGLLVLFRVNRNLKENIKIATILYVIGVISGIILELVGLAI
jgi:peptidoglycan biosynthesis protein MviN/MurJ (putative lipid II flippase)